MNQVQLENKFIRAIITPNSGGAVTMIEHVPTGLSILGNVPWTVKARPPEYSPARTEAEWLPGYSGGWELLFPNAGDSCEFAGVTHGFHGEGSVSAWQIDGNDGNLVLRRRFVSLPFLMVRKFTLEGDTLFLTEELTSHSHEPVDVMWGQHPTFGRDMLASPFEITSSARQVVVDHAYDPPGNPLRPGSRGQWPMVEGKTGAINLSQPSSPSAALAYLLEFDDAWVGVRRLDNAIAAHLSWDSQIFPCMWLWIECEGTQDPPWCGKTRLLGLEPNSTWPARGLNLAHKAGGTLLRILPGQVISHTMCLRVYVPDIA